MSKLVNFLAFQFGWFACVLGAAWERPLVGTMIAAVIVTWHLAQAAKPRQEMSVVLIVAAIGALWDSLLAALGWIQYPNGVLLSGTAPYWILALWTLFATTLNESLAWLNRSLPLAVAFGALGGPLAYFAGGRLGALVFVEQTAALVALAIGWAVLTPLLLRIASRYRSLPMHERDHRLQPEMGHG